MMDKLLNPETFDFVSRFLIAGFVIYSVRGRYVLGKKPHSEGYVIVTYDDYTQVLGYFGQNSLAASDEGPSDLYLERIYEASDDGKWKESNPPKSVLLTLNNVRSIEFFEPEGNDT